MLGLAPISATPFSSLLGVVWNVSVSEAANGSEAVATANNIFNSALLETITASDAVSSLQVQNADISEAATGADTVISVTDFVASVLEYGTAADIASAVQIFTS